MSPDVSASASESSASGFQPYVGPRPFEREHASIFFGRNREAQNTADLLVAHSDVLLYSQSGAGKTSMVNAKLLPLLEVDKFEILPSTRVQGVLLEADKALDIKNIYAFHALTGWNRKDPGAEPPALSSSELATLSIAEFLERRPHVLDEEESPRLRIAIFDQFEELFTFYPERWSERADFFQQIREALLADVALRVLFVMREDHIAQLDPYASILPESLNTRIRLERLREPVALEAIQKPLIGTGRHFAAGAAEELVQKLIAVNINTADGKTISVKEEFVEPVQLQVVCQSLWQSLLPKDTEITSAHVEKVGDIDTVLTKYYEESIQKVAEKTGVREGDLRWWFENILITPLGTRGTVFQDVQKTGSIDNKAVEELEGLHLIRGEWRGGARWYELTHDRFIAPIRNARAAWLAARPEALQMRQQFEDRANIWHSLGAGEEGLLNATEVRSIQGWLDGPDAAGLGYSARLKEFVAASKTANDNRSRNVRFSLLVLLAVLAVLAVLLFRISAQKDSARALAASAVQQLSIDPELSVLLAAEAMRKSPRTMEAEEALRLALQESHLRVTLRGHKSTVNSAVFSPTEELVATASSDKTAQIWDARTGELIRTLEHTGAVNGVAFCANGVAVVTSSDDGAVQVWDAGMDSAQRLIERAKKAKVSTSWGGGRIGSTQVLKHGAKVNNAVFNREGDALVTSCEDGTAQLWSKDLRLGRWGRKRVFRNVALPGPSVVSYAIFSPDGNFIACAVSRGKSTEIDVWDTKPASNEPKKFLPGILGRVSNIAFSPDGQSLVFCGEQDPIPQIWQWQVVPRAQIKTIPESVIYLKGHTDTLNSAIFSPDGTQVVTSSDDRTARVWNARDGRLRMVLRGHDETVYSAQFSADGQRIVTASKDGTSRIWDADTGEVVLDLLGHTKSVKSAVLTHNGQQVLTASEDGTAKIWIVETGKVLLKTKESFNCALYSLDGAWVVGANDDGYMRLQNSESKDVKGAKKADFRANGKTYWTNFSRDGRYLVVAGSGDKVRYPNAVQINDTVQIVEREKLQEKAPVLWSVHPRYSATSAAFSSDGRDVVVGTGRWQDKNGDGGVFVYKNWAQGNRTPQLKDIGVPVRSVEFNGDGTSILIAREDGKAQILDARTFEPQQSFEEPDGATLYSAAFSPDGARVVTSSADRTARIWDVKSGKTLFVLRGHTSAVWKANFDFGGKRVVTASADRTARIWDAESGKTLAILRGHTEPIRSATFSPDGRAVLTAGYDGTVREYTLDIPATSDLLGYARQRVTRQLTQDERSQYLRPLQLKLFW